MKTFGIAGIMVLMLLPLVSVSGAETLIYGPEAFSRTAGAPDVYTDSFSAVSGSAYLVLFNGDDEQDSRVSSGSVILNGAQIISPNDLNPQVDHIIQPVGILSANTLEVTLNGAPGGYVTILIVTDKKNLPEFTVGRIQLAWTTISDPARSVALRLKNGSPQFPRCFTIRYFNEDGSLAGVSTRQELGPHASLQALLQSFLPDGSAWQTGSVEILFAGQGGGRILGFGIENSVSAQTETAIPLQWGGLRHFFNPTRKR